MTSLNGPLHGIRVLEYADGPAAGFAGLLLRMLGAQVDACEPGGRSRLRDLPPRHDGVGMLHGYLAAGKRVRPLRELTAGYLAEINVVVHDEELPPDLRQLVSTAPMPERGRVTVRCTPYGATGPKSGWLATELSLFQAGGEGYLMPHGLPYEEHPDRPPIGVGRYSAHYQGGIAAALAAVAALRHARATGKPEAVDVSVQDAQVSLNYFTVSRYVEGARESRATRAFRFAGILRCRDGWVELVPLESHHWGGILKLLDHPPELMTPEFADSITRAARGAVINRHLRSWAADRLVAEVVARANEAGIPCGPYLSPDRLPEDRQLVHRGYFVSDRDQPARAELFPGPAWNFDRWPRPRLGRAASNEEGRDATA